MTRFLYIADTHLGANPMGYQQQEGYPEKLPEILAVMSDYLDAEGGVDFILHGGDMIDGTTDDTIVAAADAFDLAVPVYLCLGNHDLTTPDAVERWLSLAPRFFPKGTPDYTLEADQCVIHVTPNHWCDRPFYWHEKQSPHFSSSQTEHLGRELNRHPDLPHILLTHCPVHGLPTGQTGFPEPYHCPDASFTAEVTGLATGHANLKCVLGAHNHMNMCVNQGGPDYVTVSALVETPFEFKLFQVTPQRLEMSTMALCPALPFGNNYDTAKAFAQGRPCDRSLVTEFGA